MTRRYFTAEEANQLLPTVEPLVRRMVSHRRRLAVATARHSRIAAKIAGNGGGVDPHEVDELRARVESEAAAVAACVDELQRLGLLVKDLDEGLVDFPARAGGGDEVLLCWRLGEESVAYWHTAEAGFAGRRPLPIE